MLVLGFDPGSRNAGYGIVEVVGTRERHVAHGVVALGTIDEHQDRLKALYDALAAVIAEHRPDACAVEMPVYGKNPQSMLKLGRAQAVGMLAALNAGIPVTQYGPKEVKKSVTGRGNATKEQVAFMVRSMLGLPADVKIAHDATDALAVALCHAGRMRGAPQGKQHKSWASFLAANPGRVKG